MATLSQRPDREFSAMLDVYRPWTVIRPTGSRRVSTLRQALRLAVGAGTAWNSTIVASADGRYRIEPRQLLRLSRATTGRVLSV
jgi:hypothetical protein